MVVDEPTHLGGGLIDQVYVRKSLLNHFKLTSSICNIFFSDHDAVKIKLEMKR